MATKSSSRKDTRGAGNAGRVQMIRTQNGLPDDARQEMVRLLNERLADAFDLFSQTKQAHWNVKGPQFFQLHELYDDLAAQLLAHVDLIAERATAMGGAATGTARMAAQATHIDEFPEGFVGSKESVQLLVDRYARVTNAMREAIDQAEQAEDMATSDLFITVTQELDKALWFLESHIQENG